MSIDPFPVGAKIRVSDPDIEVTLQSTTKLTLDIPDGPFARTESVDIHIMPLGNGLFVVSWQEKDGATVTQTQNHDRELIHSHATLPDGRLLRMTGTFTVAPTVERAIDDRPHWNKALVLEAMTSLFQRRNASAVDRLYAPDYLQHTPDISQGRDALRALVARLTQAVG